MINGLPAHPSVHFVVVLAPLTAVLAILCAVWPAARQRLVWSARPVRRGAGADAVYHEDRQIAPNTASANHRR